MRDDGTINRRAGQTVGGPGRSARYRQLTLLYDDVPDADAMRAQRFNVLLETRLLTAAQPVVDADLAKLADDRSAAIQGYMIEMQTIPPERIAIQEYDVNDDNQDWVRCKLALDAMD